jgi:hypothetical protein
VAPEFIPVGEAQEVNASFSHQPMIDQLLANEWVGDGTYWPLTDHLGTVRDLVTFNGTTTTNVEHRVFDSFGNLVSDNNSTLSDTFSFTDASSMSTPSCNGTSTAGMIPSWANG